MRWNYELCSGSCERFVAWECSSQPSNLIVKLRSKSPLRCNVKIHRPVQLQQTLHWNEEYFDRNDARKRDSSTTMRVTGTNWSDGDEVRERIGQSRLPSRTRLSLATMVTRTIISIANVNESFNRNDAREQTSSIAEGIASEYNVGLQRSLQERDN